MSGDWTPANERQHPPFEQGNDVAVKHGASAALKLAPRADEIASAVRRVVPAGDHHDEPTIRLLAGVLARIEAANEWLAENTIFADKEGNAQPILKQLSAWENTAGRLCEKLGLTPLSRAELGLDLARIYSEEQVKRDYRALMGMVLRHVPADGREAFVADLEEAIGRLEQPELAQSQLRHLSADP